jgi:hypothetical protein
VRQFRYLVVLLLPLLFSCKKTLIFPAPGAVVPGTYLVKSMKEGEDVSKWTVEFSHQANGAWVSDMTVSMAKEPALVVDKLTMVRYWPKAGPDVDRYRIQVWEGKSLLDEKVLTLKRAR